MVSLSEVKASLLGGFFLSSSVLLVTFFSPNTHQTTGIYDLELKDGARWSEINHTFREDKVLRNFLSFQVASWILGNNDTVPSGLYQIKKGWNNWSIIRHLRSSTRPAVQVVVEPHLMRSNTLKTMCRNLDIKHTALAAWLENDSYLSQLAGFNKDNIYCLLLPDTLMIYKDSRVGEVADRLLRNYLDFWNPDRLEDAASLGLTPQEVIVLASIVYAETKIPQEMPVIAGLYLNRLQMEMRLQADPTVVYAAGRPLTRVLKTHKRIRSRYNTYRIEGLPPGPVFTPSKQAIQSALSPRKHDFLYFCARYDFSGYHQFSRTLEEHQQAARKYQRALNRNKIGIIGGS